MSDDRAEIEETVNDYLHGIRDSDPDRVARAFHPEATMTGHFGGTYGVTQGACGSIAEFMRQIPPTSEHSPNFAPRIVRVDQHGTLANVEVEENQLQGKDMRTFFILHRVDGRWRIASKGTWAPD